MDYSFISLILFIVATLLYFIFLKPTLSVDNLSTLTGLAEYYSACNSKLIIYMVVVICSQLFLNFFYLVSKCGGSPVQNIGAAIGYTLVPYIFIFGVLIGVLVIFPGFKSAFSNVIGYFYISSAANTLLSDLLVNSDIVANNSEISEEKQEALEKSASMIMKICGNKSLLINQINPNNFINMWDTMLLPLAKNTLTAEVLKTKKEELLALVITKDNIGEMVWYIYSGILVTSIVAYNLATRGCVKSVEQIKTEHDEYIKSREEAMTQSELENQTAYS